MHSRPLLFSLLIIGSWFSAGALRAQDDAPQPSNEPLGSELADLEQLFAPIALYPDALVALILPAATVPSDVVLAARRLATEPAATSFDDEPWDDSVRGLARYPEVVKWMDENLAWTKQAGEAFLEEPAEVMNAIQRLRERAQAAGTLTNTPQQRVVAESSEIRIVPTRTEVIYVPRYDPAVVFFSRPAHYPRPYLTFGIGYPVGYWLAYDFDWHRRTVFVVHRHHRVRHWREVPDWRDRYHSRIHHRRLGDSTRWHAWQPRGRVGERRVIIDRARRDLSRAPTGFPPPVPHSFHIRAHRPEHDRSRLRVPERRTADAGAHSRRGFGGTVRRDLRRDSLPSGPTPSMAAPISPVPDVRSSSAPTPSASSHLRGGSHFDRGDPGSSRERWRSSSRFGSSSPAEGRSGRRSSGISRERRSSELRGAHGSSGESSPRQWGRSRGAEGRPDAGVHRNFRRGARGE